VLDIETPELWRFACDREEGEREKYDID